MQFTFSDQLKQFLRVMQGSLFPELEQQLGPLTGKLQQLVMVLGMIEIETMVSSWPGGVGRPAKDRRAIARSFAAKAVYNMSTTRQLLDRLSSTYPLGGAAHNINNTGQDGRGAGTQSGSSPHRRIGARAGRGQITHTISPRPLITKEPLNKSMF